MTESTPYFSKEEKKIPINDPTGKWTDLTLLPEWEEPICDVYTARKHGKWVMLKVLKKQYADKPEYQQKLEKEFDIRYNLSNANICMVNDFEEVPGLGMAIITDDVYGYSLRRLIDEHRLTPRILYRLQTQLLDAITYLHENHVVHYPIMPDNIIFTEFNENLKLCNVGYDQTDSLSPQAAQDDIQAYGRILNEVLDNLPTQMPRLRRIARKCEEPSGYPTIDHVQLAIERRSSAQIYVIICVLITILAAVLIWLTVK